MTNPQWATPDLQTLVDLFYKTGTELGNFSEIRSEEMPQAYRSLLAHSQHMTVTLEELHQSRVDVHVLEKLVTDLHYSRKILLTRQSDDQPVLFGVVRLTSGFLANNVRAEIESESIPLGQVLIDHNILRNVKLLSLWKIKPAAELASLLKIEQGTSIYGRTALIYCDGIPAVELLEIVSL